MLRKAVQAERQPYSGACSSTSKRSPLASTNLVCISGIQHIDLIRQYRGAGIDLLINDCVGPTAGSGSYSAVITSPVTALRCPEHVPSPSRTLRNRPGNPISHGQCRF